MTGARRGFEAALPTPRGIGALVSSGTQTTKGQIVVGLEAAWKTFPPCLESAGWPA